MANPDTDERLRRVERRTTAAVDLHRRLEQALAEADTTRRYFAVFAGLAAAWAFVITVLVLVMWA